MPGKAAAVTSGESLKREVVRKAKALGLEARTEVKVARRIWGARRSIDVVLTHPKSGLRLGIECKYQGTPGTTEEKVPTTLEDIRAWPIKGIVVIAGPGFSDNMKAFLIGSGSVVELDDLEDWLRLYFGL